MRNLHWLGWTTLIVLGIACASQVCSSDEKKPLATVQAEDLCNGNCRIIGRLGKPYGEISRVRGVWEYGKNLPKPEGPSLRITHIDGKELAADRHIIFRHGFVKSMTGNRKANVLPRSGEVLDGKVYEAGGYPEDCPPPVVGPPGGPHAIVQPPPWAGFAFHSFLYFLD
jgi:hypothetical protein